LTASVAIRSRKQTKFTCKRSLLVEASKFLNKHFPIFVPHLDDRGLEPIMHGLNLQVFCCLTEFLAEGATEMKLAQQQNLLSLSFRISAGLSHNSHNNSSFLSYIFNADNEGTGLGFNELRLNDFLDLRNLLCTPA
jgi:hypothetical protein